ncbi:MAG: hypothetical protein CMI54_04120 [Parcubacteria group bacterium]|nr:hypothetical protein [Parcubacteria group bacterium]|tara:strand:+ start:472 stop:792 length:321 start_codon:yes stop_codon:yes gene_type:complete
MSNPKAAPISAKEFVSAYVQTHQAGGTIADLATSLHRSVEQVRAKKNSLFANLKKQGVALPSLKRQERNGSNYLEAANIANEYIASMTNEGMTNEGDTDGSDGMDS